MENRPEKAMSLEEKISRLAKLLEGAGYEKAENLIREEIIPLTVKNNCSILEALDGYADAWEEQDTSWQQLHLVLTKIEKTDLDFLR